MTTKPHFITFTGADDRTQVADMLGLANAYPVEFGVLFSPKLTGTPRYPSGDWVSSLVATSADRLHLSAHICGDYSRELLDTGTIRDLGPLLASGAFARIQINTSDPGALRQLEKISAFGESLGVEVILQSRDPLHFPRYSKVQWLFDASGGRGILPERWPVDVTGRMVGFAGGLRSSNVLEAVDAIGTETRSYWIDMETGVRSSGDQFSIHECRQVCELVYGQRGMASDRG